MLYQCKKLYGGRVSVRSYIVEYCIKMKLPLTVKYEGRYMKIKRLRDYECDERPQIAQLTDKYIKKGETYKLYDYIWNPMPQNEEKIEFTEEGRLRLLEAWKRMKAGIQEKISFDK